MKMKMIFKDAQLKQLGLEKWVFTFGIGTEYADKHVVIWGKDYFDARKIMFEYYGEQWAFPYSWEDWQDVKKQGFEEKSKTLEVFVTQLRMEV